MPPLSLMIKPVSGGCNLRCKYCFYQDLTQQREVPSYGRMSEYTLEQVIKKALAYAHRRLFIVFQGGEPMLRGLDFYKKAVFFEQKYNIKKVEITNCIQTNGLLIDEEWAGFLAANHFLVGVSLDGPRSIHDRWRVDENDCGSFDRVLASARLLERHKVDFNVLTVVTAQAARQAQAIYSFFRRNGLRYQQYIPCLDPLGEQRGARVSSLTPELYAKFLIELFDLWYTDLNRGHFVYIRYFDNIAAMLRGLPPESCGLNGMCSRQYVVEADGGVYPCDFYVLDEYLLGNLCQDEFPALDAARERIGFIAASVCRDPRCMDCCWRPLCNGGCRRDREGQFGLGNNYFCEAYQAFFSYALPKYRQLLNN
jgi:uncharacterized protein